MAPSNAGDRREQSAAVRYHRHRPGKQPRRKKEQRLRVSDRRVEDDQDPSQVGSRSRLGQVRPDFKKRCRPKVGSGLS